MVVICVDNTPILLQTLRENAARVFPHAMIKAFLSEEQALDFARESGCDILMCEINPPGLEGLFLAEKIKELNSRVNIIFVTVCSECEYAKEVMNLKPSGYLTKEATDAQIVDELCNLRYQVS